MPIVANVIEEAFSPLITVFESILVFIHNNIVGGSWGLAIIGLTVLIRAVLVPLTLKQFRTNPRLADQLSVNKAARKEVQQIQVGARAERQLQHDELSASAFAGGSFVLSRQVKNLTFHAMGGSKRRYEKRVGL